MAFSCIHTHTTFSDGSDDVETFCQRAFEKGLDSLGFSEHAPITGKTGIPSSWNLPDERLPAYIEAVQAAKKRWQGKLNIYLGLEVDYIQGLMGPADRDFQELGLDFIIGTVHYLVPPKGEPFTVDDTQYNMARGIRECYNGDVAAAVEAYWDSLGAMIRAGGFDLLGHPDLIKKNNAFLGLFSEDDDAYRQRTAAIAALMAGTGLPAEVNTGGMNRGKINDCYPSHGFLLLFKEQGVPMVINADAHRAEDLDGHYEEARKAMLAAGYTETLLFNGREKGRALSHALSPALWKNAKL
jgi:histidinol-phosphatase (PHP family)